MAAISRAFHDGFNDHTIGFARIASLMCTKDGRRIEAVIEMRHGEHVRAKISSASGLTGRSGPLDQISYELGRELAAVVFVVNRRLPIFSIEFIPEYRPANRSDT